ncbi:unnamed protein product [Oikopleura dioica]|uniref:Charged multivesicular body protein 3 n=1 Tax=Oikopleura dioica TaxID=34765 RepID=E4YAG4_OIKDI|nr:unnamed protein product [Oikopleura dioica]
MGLFGTTKVDPKKMVSEMSAGLRKETRAIDRQILQIEREQQKTKAEIKKHAKKNDIDVCKILAKELVNSQKAVSRMHASKAQINSVMMNMRTQAATIRMTGAIEKSTQVMQSMSKLVKLPELQKTMTAMSKEMMKMGIIDELMDDAMESLDPEDMEEEVDAQVEKVLHEITKGELGSLPSAGTSVPASQVAQPAAAESDDEDDMLERLNALKS